MLIQNLFTGCGAVYPRGINIQPNPRSSGRRPNRPNCNVHRGRCENPLARDNAEELQRYHPDMHKPERLGELCCSHDLPVDCSDHDKFVAGHMEMSTFVCFEMGHHLEFFEGQVDLVDVFHERLPVMRLENTFYRIPMG